MIGFTNTTLFIERKTGSDIRGVPQYSSPISVSGFLIEKSHYDYVTNKTTPYFFITLPSPGLVSKEDKINGHRVESVKEVYLHGKFVVCEVTAL